MLTNPPPCCMLQRLSAPRRISVGGLWSIEQQMIEEQRLLGAAAARAAMSSAPLPQQPDLCAGIWETSHAFRGPDGKMDWRRLFKSGPPSATGAASTTGSSAAAGMAGAGASTSPSSQQ